MVRTSASLQPSASSGGGVHPNQRGMISIKLKRSVISFALVPIAFLMGCASAVVPTSTSTPTTGELAPTGTTPTPATTSPAEMGPVSTATPETGASVPPEPLATSTSGDERIAVDLRAVPIVDLSIHSVPLDDIVFDTFDGSFERLDTARPRLIRALRDVIEPIYNPGYGVAGDLPWLGDSDLVIGYLSKESAYAYPVKVLNFRELVNDVIDGQPVLVSYCPLCASGAIYSREMDGTALLFGNTGALYQSDLVMFDHQTGSYWFQVLGEAVVGEMTGTRLTSLPSMTLTWGEWRRLHPDTRLLTSDGEVSFGSRFGVDPFDSSYADRLDGGKFPFPVSEELLDSRLRAAEIVITAEVNSAIKAYPLRRIGDAAVNDVVGGKRVVVFSRSATGSAFLATVSGKELIFQMKGGAFVDSETGSTWNAVGRAVNGPLSGTDLEHVPSRRAFWFSIAGAIPGLELYLP